MPNRDSERTSTRSGKPEIPCSTRAVIWRSISSGASAGATVLTCTCTGVVSGKASIGRRAYAMTPAMAIASHATITIKR
jgi:hypothetical protein